MGIGRRIRDLRLRRGMTVQQLADASGLSKGFVSQVENGRTSPSLASLHDLAAALGTSVAHLVAEDEATPHVVRAHERPRLETGDGTAPAEVLSALPRRDLELLLVELPAGRTARLPRDSHDGETCLVCLAGRVELGPAGRAITLETGDSCHYEGRMRHGVRNAGAGVARLLVAMAPAGLGARHAARPATTGARPVPDPAPTE